MNAAAVDDGLEPTMVEREQPQLVLVSTAHRRATSLMIGRRADALSTMYEPRDVLLIEWSSARDVDLDDRDAWRAASPHWTAKRERLIESKWRRALAGNGDDPDEDDPVESFKSQWLNAWPGGTRVASGREVPLLLDSAWDLAGDLTTAVPAGPLTLAVEDWYGNGAAAAAAGRRIDGRVLVWGRTFGSRVDAAEWCTALAVEHEGSRLLVGASLDGDPTLAALPVVGVETRGGAQTRTALPALRQALADGAVVHDGGEDLASQLASLLVVPSVTGLLLSPRSGRSDLARCAAWALHAALAVPVLDFFVY